MRPPQVLQFAVFAVFLMFHTRSVDCRICGEIDIRNFVDEFETKLRNCTTVVGSVNIALIHKRAFDFSNVTFPELREITGFLVFYRISGLKSLENLFPNLAVIRGEQLVKHYALVIFELPDLVEIGLKSLVKVLRGFVLVRFCPVLCYAHTIDWISMTQPHIEGILGNYIEDADSVMCPTSISCPESCPSKHCWNNRLCQRFDSDHITAVKDFQCHSECIGGCVNSTANGCTACTHYRIKGHDTCVDKCPAHLFIFGNMCVPPEFCIKHQKKPFQGECHDACPPNYVDTDIDGKPLPLDNPCTKCVYQCNLRECPGGEIDSLDMSLYWKGCQIVRGDLYIRLRFGVSDTISILERNLGDIEEIDGLLKIYRSPAIKSLEFFRSLRKIHGSNLHEDKYSFVLMENENLESLWDFREKKSLRLVKGNLLIHYNSKLCNEDIVALQKLVNTNPAEDFIGQDSNGFEDACTQRDIETDFYEVTHKSINIRWERLEYNNIRPIGYIIFYIEAPERNITHLELHSCGRIGWQSRYVDTLSWYMGPADRFYNFILENLHPNTQYAYLVRTQDLQKDGKNNVINVVRGQSIIKYFKTFPNTPAFPVVETEHKSHDSITLNWFPYTLSRDIVTYYRLHVYIVAHDPLMVEYRNYCLEPHENVHTTTSFAVKTPKPVKSCQEEYDEWSSRHGESIDAELEWKMYRQAICQSKQLDGIIYESKRYYCNKADDKRCSSDSTLDDTEEFGHFLHDFVTKNEPDKEPETIAETDRKLAYLREQSDFIKDHMYDSALSTGTVAGLLPYTTYIFQLRPCNDRGCGSYAMHSDRTDTIIEADNVENFSASADPEETTTIHVDFSAPKTPNGLTLSYEIEMQSVTDNKISVICIPHNLHISNNERRTFTNLAKGHYNFRVRSSSLGMTGAYTKHQTVTVYIRYGMFEYSIIAIVLSIIIGLATWLYLFLAKRRSRNMNASRQNLTEMDVLAQAAEERANEERDNEAGCSTAPRDNEAGCSTAPRDNEAGCSSAPRDNEAGCSSAPRDNEAGCSSAPRDNEAGCSSAQGGNKAGRSSAPRDIEAGRSSAPRDNEAGCSSAQWPDNKRGEAGCSSDQSANEAGCSSAQWPDNKRDEAGCSNAESAKGVWTKQKSNKGGKGKQKSTKGIWGKPKFTKGVWGKPAPTKDVTPKQDPTEQGLANREWVSTKFTKEEWDNEEWG